MAVISVVAVHCSLLGSWILLAAASERPFNATKGSKSQHKQFRPLQHSFKYNDNDNDSNIPSFKQFENRILNMINDFIQNDDWSKSAHLEQFRGFDELIQDSGGKNYSTLFRAKEFNVPLNMPSPPQNAHQKIRKPNKLESKHSWRSKIQQSAESYDNVEPESEKSNSFSFFGRENRVTRPQLSSPKYEGSSGNDDDSMVPGSGRSEIRAFGKLVKRSLDSKSFQRKDFRMVDELVDPTPAKRLVSSTVKSFIAPIFDLGKTALEPVEPMKYSKPTIGHHKNEPFNKQLVEDIYDYEEAYLHPIRKGDHNPKYHNTYGDKTSKGYKNHQDFDEGEHGHYGSEGNNGFFNDKSGHKKKYHDEGDHFGSRHGMEHGKKGGHYGEAGHHRKGHKTTGYHNTYHKDEFKKEHKFYDDVHKEGHHNKQGQYLSGYDKKSAGKNHGGFLDSAYNEGHKGNTGFYDKGNYGNEHKGYKGTSGLDSHFGHFDEFGKKSGFGDNSKFGFSDHF